MGLDTVESLSAGAARDPNRNMGTVIIVYIFVTFTNSNIKLYCIDSRKCQIWGLGWTILGKIFLLLYRFKKVSDFDAGVDNCW